MLIKIKKIIKFLNSPIISPLVTLFILTIFGLIIDFLNKKVPLINSFLDMQIKVWIVLIIISIFIIVFTFIFKYFRYKQNIITEKLNKDIAMLQNKIEQQESIIHELKSKQKENEEKITKKSPLLSSFHIGDAVGRKIDRDDIDIDKYIVAEIKSNTVCCRDKSNKIFEFHPEELYTADECNSIKQKNRNSIRQILNS